MNQIKTLSELLLKNQWAYMMHCQSWKSKTWSMFFISSFITDSCLFEVLLCCRAELEINRTVKIEY